MRGILAMAVVGNCAPGTCGDGGTRLLMCGERACLPTYFYTIESFPSRNTCF